MRDFRKLLVWEKSHILVLEIYKATQNFPNTEQYGLTSQIRRAAISIPANIAEGCGKNTEIELARYMQISMGSASELEYHILLAHDLKYLSDDLYRDLNSRVVEVKRMLAPFINKLRSS
ncbi:MAG: four helix bundle protein [Aggregatilineales bacterium]